MAKKKIEFRKKRPPVDTARADAIVGGDSKENGRPTGGANMARLTIDIDRGTHLKLKRRCLDRGLKLADLVRSLIDRELASDVEPSAAASA